MVYGQRLLSYMVPCTDPSTLMVWQDSLWCYQGWQWLEWVVEVYGRLPCGVESWWVRMISCTQPIVLILLWSCMS